IYKTYGVWTMIIGYARVSTEDQSLTVQEQAIKQYAEDNGEECVIYQEKQSGGKANREELHHALKATQRENKFVVYKLDRLAMSTKQLYNISDELREKGAEFISILDHIDTTTSTGKAMFGMLAVFAEFERDIIRERTRAGLESAKQRGRTGGRPEINSKTKKQIRILFSQGESASDIAKLHHIGRSTVYKILKEQDT